jgi:ribosomal protein S18 acetylase RimI-like enzyme
MDTDLSLRDAGDADRGFLLRLFMALRAREWGLPEASCGSLQPLLHGQFDAQARAYRTAHPQSRCQVILEAGRPVGRLWVDRAASGIRILDISIEPAHQGRGIGRAVLGRVLAEAQRNAVPVSLAVAQENPAGHLYRRLGFAVTAERPPYLEMRWWAAASMQTRGAVQ